MKTLRIGLRKLLKITLEIGTLVAAGCSVATEPEVPSETIQTNRTQATGIQRAADSGKTERAITHSGDRVRHTPEELSHAAGRRGMVADQLQGRDITDRRVLSAMGRVRRHLLVPENVRSMAYLDQPLPIGYGQTISQPYIVALMTQLVRPRPDAVVLDVGTGSGYQAAVLAELVEKVYSIEIVPELAERAERQLKSLGYQNIEVRAGDGYRGWPEHAPFDAIIVAAAPDHVPQPLVDQLAPGGRLVIPVGSYFQTLIMITKEADGTVHQERVAGVRFVPMTGEAQRGD